MMTNATTSISVVICAYTEERWHDLVAAVESLRNQNARPLEVIVVIDHNTPLFERVRTYIPGVIAIENSEPQGLSGARNSGIALAQGTFIAFLDDDAIAEPDWLELLNRCCVDPQILGAGGMVIPLWLGTQPAWFPEEFYWVVGCTYRGLPKKQAVVRNPYGGCACYRREVFETVGGFRNGVGREATRLMGGEETELCIRAHRHWPQRVFLYEPQARIRHRIPSHRVRWRYFRSRCYAEGLSKAMVSRYAGAKNGLASESAYTLRTLPSGVVHGVMDGFFHLDLIGFLRAGAIIAGLLITTAGYVVGAISQRFTVTKKGEMSTNYKLK